MRSIARRSLAGGTAAAAALAPAVLVASALFAPPALAAPLPKEAEKLSPKSFEPLHRFLVPQKDEQVWESIPWRTTLWQAVGEAESLDRPILLWAMNGHPLACT